MMGVGISGVFGVSKEILAEQYAKETDHELVTFDSYSLFLPARTKVRLKSMIQEYNNILAQLESAYMQAPDRFVTDVTPLDVVAEMYSLFAWHTIPTEENDKDINEVWDYACRICSKHLMVLMHIQPFECGGRQEQVNALTVGLIHTRMVNEVETTMFTVRRGMTDIESRLVALKHFVHGKYIKETPFGISSSLKH